MSCGTGTVTIEANLFHQLAVVGEEVLYVIFLDLNNTYDALDKPGAWIYWKVMACPPEPVGSSRSIGGNNTGRRFRELVE